MATLPSTPLLAVGWPGCVRRRGQSSRKALLWWRKCARTILYTRKFTVVVHQPKVIGVVVFMIFPPLIFRFFFKQKYFFRCDDPERARWVCVCPELFS